MKIKSFNSLIWTVTIFSLMTYISSPVFGGPEKIVIRDAPTNEDMLLQLKKAQASSSLSPVNSSVASQDASKMGKPDDLLEGSIILSFRGLATLIPKGSIIVYSEKYKSHLQKAPGDKLMEFKEFLTENRSWLSTYEVSFAQAQGKVPLDVKAKAQMTKSGNVVVATFRGNPIQILPPIPSIVASAEKPSQSNKP